MKFVFPAFAAPTKILNDRPKGTHITWSPLKPLNPQIRIWKNNQKHEFHIYLLKLSLSRIFHLLNHHYIDHTK